MVVFHLHRVIAVPTGCHCRPRSGVLFIRVLYRGGGRSGASYAPTMVAVRESILSLKDEGGSCSHGTCRVGDQSLGIPSAIHPYIHLWASPIISRRTRNRDLQTPPSELLHRFVCYVGIPRPVGLSTSFLASRLRPRLTLPSACFQPLVHVNL